ncbi:PIH1 domain-containing protein 2-like [Lingula anatina]|uniref:PIH1 domain-containing protein 2-like n=1 Tax=Lingula anatina TaxID=7574 RepID=A0A1S3JD79_LINAN|nr:PIH1 domain-containing protein 2-like [Lingula anatina]|eukprot:XP_013408362.1 PIH1 domain-containing protein 2-like [Lingula anatina]
MTSEEDNSKMLREAQRVWSMLDDMSENNPAAYRKFIDKHVKEGKEFLKPPQPCMCVKTGILKEGYITEKLYVSVFGWNRVPKPKIYDTDPIPVMGSKIMTSRDEEEDEDIKVVSIAFNPQIVQDYGHEAENPAERDALINLGLDYVQDQQKVTISRNYKLLDESTLYKGDLAQLRQGLTQRFQKEDDEYNKQMSDLQKMFGPIAESNESLIGQLSNLTSDDSKVKSSPPVQKETEIRVPGLSKQPSKNTNKANLIQEVSSSGEKDGRTPKHEMCVKDSTGSKPRRVEVKVHLPEVGSVQECELDISEDDLSLTVAEKYELKVTFPEKIRDAHSSAKFSTKSHTLTVNLPTIKQS